MKEYSDSLDEIIEQKLPRAEILRAYRAGEISNPEWLLLFSLDDEAFFRDILRGVGEYHIPYDSTVPRDAYFTNVPLLMRAFYSLHVKYPLYHFDILFEHGLNALASSRFDLYCLLYFLHYHLQKERDGKASFVIHAAPFLRKAAVYLQDEWYLGILSKRRDYDAASYEDGMLGLYRHYDELFLKAAGVSILPEQGERK